MAPVFSVLMPSGNIWWLVVASAVSRNLAIAELERPSWPSCASEATCLFTSEELRNYTGRGEERTILLSVVSYVFNVTKAPEYYSKRIGQYASLAGAEASRALGTMSMDEEDVTSHRLDDLEEEQWEELFKWIDKYQAKYQLVGRLTDWQPGVTIEDIN